MDAARRRKLTLAIRWLLAAGLLALTWWWVVPTHSWEEHSPVIWTVSATHGIHRSDLPAFAFVLVAGLLVLPYRWLGRKFRISHPASPETASN